MVARSKPDAAFPIDADGDTTPTGAPKRKVTGKSSQQNKKPLPPGREKKVSQPVIESASEADEDEEEKSSNSGSEASGEEESGNDGCLECGLPIYPGQELFKHQPKVHKPCGARRLAVEHSLKNKPKLFKTLKFLRSKKKNEYIKLMRSLGTKKTRWAVLGGYAGEARTGH